MPTRRKERRGIAPTSTPSPGVAALATGRPRRRVRELDSIPGGKPPSIHPHITRQMESISHLLMAPPPSPGGDTESRLAELRMQCDLLGDEIEAKSETLSLTLRGLEFLRRARQFSSRAREAVSHIEETWRRRAEEAEVVKAARALERAARLVCDAANPLWHANGRGPKRRAGGDAGRRSYVSAEALDARGSKRQPVYRGAGKTGGDNHQPRDGKTRNPIPNYNNNNNSSNGNGNNGNGVGTPQRRRPAAINTSAGNGSSPMSSPGSGSSPQRRKGADKRGTLLPSIGQGSPRQQHRRDAQRDDQHSTRATTKQKREARHGNGGGNSGAHGAANSPNSTAVPISSSSSSSSLDNNPNGIQDSSPPGSGSVHNHNNHNNNNHNQQQQSRRPETPSATFADLQTAWTRLESLGGGLETRVSSPGPRAALERVASACDKCVRLVISTFGARLDRAEKAIAAPHELPRVPEMLDAIASAERGARWVLRRSGAREQLAAIDARLQALRIKCDDAQLRALVVVSVAHARSGLKRARATLNRRRAVRAMAELPELRRELSGLREARKSLLGGGAGVRRYGAVSSTLADIAAAEKEILARIAEAEGRKEERRRLLRELGELEAEAAEGCENDDDGDEDTDENVAHDKESGCETTN